MRRSNPRRLRGRCSNASSCCLRTRSSARRRLPLQVGLGRCSGRHLVVCISVLLGCAVSHDRPGSLLGAQHACISPKLSSRSRTSGCILDRICSTPGRDQSFHHRTSDSDSVGHVGCSLSHIDCKQLRVLLYLESWSQLPSPGLAVQAQGQN